LSGQAVLPQLVPLLHDPEPRVRFFAALSLRPCDVEGIRQSPPAKDGSLARQAVTAVLEMLRENADRDPYLRHAGVVALSHFPTLLDEGARDGEPSVRLGVLLAFRRVGSPRAADFLTDPEPRIAAEAARAVHDVPIPEGLPKLAALLDKPEQSESVLW